MNLFLRYPVVTIQNVEVLPSDSCRVFIHISELVDLVGIEPTYFRAGLQPGEPPVAHQIQIRLEALIIVFHFILLRFRRLMRSSY